MTKIRAINARAKRFRLLMGAEVDILSDGSMDYPDAVLAELDFVVGSIHSGFTQSEATLTRRLVQAMRHPSVTLIAHPTGRLMGQREPYPIDFETVFRAARETGTALEINAYPKRLDLCDTAAHRANELGVMLAISTDSHSLDQLDQMTFGIGVARRAWVEPNRLLNGLSLTGLLRWIARKRQRPFDSGPGLGRGTLAQDVARTEAKGRPERAKRVEGRRQWSPGLARGAPLGGA